MIEKHAEIRPSATPCDMCGKPAVVLETDHIRCREHAGIGKGACCTIGIERVDADFSKGPGEGQLKNAGSRLNDKP